ncbi:MAG: SDR family oxidoreductase [Lachnospiraceae bacterium]|nr:SDR family oxidoreductase [Lachnospiraceae bacterium]
MANTALVTGASSGFGLEFARLLARDGYDLVLVARNKEKLVRLKKRIEHYFKVKVYVLAQDLSEEDAVNKVREFTEKEGLEIEILINNAGFGDYGPFALSDYQKQTEMIDLNVRALTQLTHAYLMSMITRGSGRILNVASIASFEPGPMMSVYYATKAYVLSFSQAISRELKGTGVTCTALCPGPTDTGFAKLAEIPDSRMSEAFRMYKPRDVAREGYRGMMKGKTVVVPGAALKATATAAKVLPSKLVTEVVYHTQQSK